MILSIKRFAITICCLGLLAACGKDDGKKLTTQVAAKVNGDEISVHQINEVLTRVPDVAPEHADNIKRQILDKLIDQQLTVQQANERKLDRTPEVMTAIENAKRDILSKAYLDQLIGGISKPTDIEAKKYYADHPDLFAQRRIYNLQEIELPANKVSMSDLQLMANSQSMQDVANWLKGKDIPFRGGAITSPAEQLPLEVLPKLATLANGQSLVADGQTVKIFHLVSSQADPVGEDKALPQITKFLANQKAGEMVKKDIAELRKKAKLEYRGEFSAVKSENSIVAPTAGIANASDSGIEKGVAGLH